jgi:hypothetical protein
MTKPGFEERRLALFVDQAARKHVGITHNRVIDEEERYYGTKIAEYDAFVAGCYYMLEQLKEQQDGSK